MSSETIPTTCTSKNLPREHNKDAILCDYYLTLIWFIANFLKFVFDPWLQTMCNAAVYNLPLNQCKQIDPFTYEFSENCFFFFLFFWYTLKRGNFKISSGKVTTEKKEKRLIAQNFNFQVYSCFLMINISYEKIFF